MHKIATLLGVLLGMGMVAAAMAADQMPGSAPASSAGPANVVSVSVFGEPGSYQFSVGIRSPDTGCDRFADWWEVLSPEGKLLYRRILFHSHVDEQPFERSGGPVPIGANDQVWVRAHMSRGGYGGVMFKGSPRGGFAAAKAASGFAAQVEKQAPLPSGCAF